MSGSAARIISCLLWLGAACFAQQIPEQNIFVVTGSVIPNELLKFNYGRLPKSIRAFDLSICNVSVGREPIVSSAIYQAVAKSNPGLQPIGRAIMLAAILRNENHSVASVLNLILGSATGVLSVLGTARASVPHGLLAGAALGSLAAQQLIGNLKPVLTADQVEKFEAQALEPALVLDGGSCVERTMFATQADRIGKVDFLSFHVR